MEDNDNQLAMWIPKHSGITNLIFINRVEMQSTIKRNFADQVKNYITEFSTNPRTKVKGNRHSN